MQTLDDPIQSRSLRTAFNLIGQKKYEEALAILENGLKLAEQNQDRVLQGLFLSGLGILYKQQNEFQKAWKYYEKAEKLIPEDPALKIISARLLVEAFAQYDTAIRKLKKLETTVGHDMDFLHQIYVIEGWAFVKKSDKKKAVDCFKKSMGENFGGMTTSGNLDFKLVEEFARKKWEPDLCLDFLKKALAFAMKKKEPKTAKLIQNLLKALETKQHENN